MIFDAAGNLYGTTSFGGAINEGTVYELSPGSGGDSTERVLHSFNVNGNDGYSPYAGLTMDASGKLYGTTVGGGTGGVTIFELRPTGGGHWAERIVYDFSTVRGGYAPNAGVIFKHACGNLYGTTYVGGAGTCTDGCGTVFAFKP